MNHFILQIKELYYTIHLIIVFIGFGWRK